MAPLHGFRPRLVKLPILGFKYRQVIGRVEIAILVDDHFADMCPYCLPLVMSRDMT